MTDTHVLPSPKPRQVKPRTGPQQDGPLELAYSLAELPTSQHRAGLAGLVYLVEFVRKKDALRGVCEVIQLDETNATVRLDQAGVRALFDELYAATNEEQETKQQRKDRHGEPLPPLRTLTKEIPVPEKEGKEAKSAQATTKAKPEAKPKVKVETYYVYPATVPRADFLRDLDKNKDKKGPWLKLWRDMIWNLLRGVPTTRGPYEDRAAGLPTTDADEAFAQLADPKAVSVPLSSTLFVGAQSVTAENVPFRDRPRFEFLLHFWPIIAQVYVPQAWNIKNARPESVGFALAIPDVCQLDRFLEVWKKHMQARNPDTAGVRPKDALVDLAIESGLDLSLRLSEAVAAIEGQHATGRVVLAVDVFHLNKDGNNVRLLSSDRVVPTQLALEEYGRYKREFWDHLFRRQRLLNLIRNRPWFFGFDVLAQTIPSEHFVPKKETGKSGHQSFFPKDARVSFEQQRKTMKDHETDPETDLDSKATTKDSKSCEDELLSQITYSLARTYVERKTEAKKKSRTESERDLRERIAKEAFLAVRSRIGADFVEYFCGTLCSVPQALSKDKLHAVGRALRNEDGQAALRTLTMLALSAVGFTGYDKEPTTGSPQPANPEQE